MLETLTHRQEGPRRDLLESCSIVRISRSCTSAFGRCMLLISRMSSKRCRSMTATRSGSRCRRSRPLSCSWRCPGLFASPLSTSPRADALVRLLSTLDPEDLGYVSASLPEACWTSCPRRSNRATDPCLRIPSYGDDTVGHYMARDYVSAAGIAHAATGPGRAAPARGAPPATDRLFVMDGGMCCAARCRCSAACESRLAHRERRRRRHDHVQPARPSRRCGQGVRALRPGLRAGR